MKKKVSIIIPCYNAGQFIDRCIRSLVRQTIGIENLELICVDDASTDDTVRRLERWEHRFPDSVFVILCETNGKQGRARNIGLTHASADLIGYVDSDDWVEATMFEKLYEVAKKYQTDITSCSYGRDLGDGKLFDRYKYGGEKQSCILIDTDNRRKTFLENAMGPVWTKLFRKDFLLGNQIYFLEGLFYEDNFFGVLAEFYVRSFYMIEEPLYHYYANSNSTIVKRNSGLHHDRIIVEKRIWEELEKRHFFEKYSEWIETRFLKMFYLNSMHLFFTRYDTLPYLWLEELKEGVLKRMPDYKTLPYYLALSEREKAFFLPLEMDMTKELWDKMAAQYCRK